MVILLFGRHDFLLPLKKIKRLPQKINLPYSHPHSKKYHFNTFTCLNISITIPLLGGQLAQLVEQGTENPCVLGSIPRLATI